MDRRTWWQGVVRGWVMGDRWLMADAWPILLASRVMA